jgi:hypothetical protein
MATVEKRWLAIWIGIQLGNLLFWAAIAFRYAKMWRSGHARQVRTEVYRFIRIMLVGVLFAMGVWSLWNYFASPEEKAKLMKHICKPDPVLGSRPTGCPKEASAPAR